AFDLRQVVAHRLHALRLLLGDAPSQVHLDKLHRPPATHPPQRPPDLGHEFVAILDHVPEGRGHKDPNHAVFAGGWLQGVHFIRLNLSRSLQASQQLLEVLLKVRELAVVDTPVCADIEMENLPFADKKYDARAATPGVANFKVNI